MAWRPNGQTGRTAQLSYRTNERALPNEDLALTSTGRAMRLHSRPAPPGGQAPIRVRRSYNRAKLDDFSNATMASARARQETRPYWANPQGFDMYQTTTGSTHNRDNASLDAVPVLKHPDYRRAPLNEKVAFVDSRPQTAPAGARRLTTGAQKPLTAREFGVRQDTDAMAHVQAVGERHIEEAAMLYDRASRPLVTMSPSQLPFGPFIRESETQAQYRIPRREGADAITFYKDNPEAAVKLNQRERRLWSAHASTRSPNNNNNKTATPPRQPRPRAPQSFRPVHATGMRSTTAATYSSPKTNVHYSPPPNYLLHVSAKPLTTRSLSTAGNIANVPNLYETSNGGYGEHEVPGSVTERATRRRSGRPVTANYSPRTASANTLDTRSAAEIAAAGEPVSGRFHGLRPSTSDVNRNERPRTAPALPTPSDEPLTTEYRQEYRRGAHQMRHQHLW